MFGGGTLADISEAWEELSRSKRQAKSRLTVEHVAGVGQVSVLRHSTPVSRHFTDL